MDRQGLYAGETPKSPAEFARDFGAVTRRYGFVINNTESMNMARTFSAHGAEVGEKFDLHMIQVCKPERPPAFVINSGKEPLHKRAIT